MRSVACAPSPPIASEPVTATPAARPLLIVTADDYGLSHGVSRGILEAHTRGVVTATSLLVVAPAAADCAPWLSDHPRLEVGIHLALVGEDPPVSSPATIPTLVDDGGRLARSWRELLPRLASGRVDLADVRRELRAQIRRGRELGVRPTYLDSHQHLHLWPGVARVVVELAIDEGIAAVRAPDSRRPGAGWGVRGLGLLLRRRLRGAGIVHPAVFAGWDHAGHHDEQTVVRLVRELAGRRARSAELALHPGHGDPETERRVGWGYRWEDELAAACAPSVRAAVRDAGFRLGGPSQL